MKNFSVRKVFYGNHRFVDTFCASTTSPTTLKVQSKKFEVKRFHFTKLKKLTILEFSASSRAVLVQITPVLGVLVGVVVTLILIAICIVIFVKIKNKVRRFVPLKPFCIL